MNIKDILKENYTLPNITYDKYGMPDYSKYLDIISNVFKKGLGKVQIQRFLQDKLEITGRSARELISKWEKVNKQKIPMKLNAEAGGGGGGAGGGGGGAGGGAGAGAGGGASAGAGASSGGDGGSASSSGDSGSAGSGDTGSADSTPSDAPTMSAPRGYAFLGSMMPSKKKKKKKKKKKLKYGDGIYENVEQMEDRLWDLKSALESARAETKNIKYADMHMDIINKVSNIAEENGIELNEYNVNQVYRAKNKLESAIYQLEEDFEEAIRDMQNEIDMYDENI